MERKSTNCIKFVKLGIYWVRGRKAGKNGDGDLFTVKKPRLKYFIFIFTWMSLS